MRSTFDSDLLMAARTGGNTDALLAELASITPIELLGVLAEKHRRRAFWLNVYNALSLLALSDGPIDLVHKTTRLKHYARKRWFIAGEVLSLNNIEHGMLRDSRVWWSLGYLRDPFPSEFERQFRVPLDPRIHFALNCGAASCPPIAFYSGDKLHAQLDIAAQGFLEESSHFDEATNTVHITPLFQWYRGDFGGSKGILEILRRYGLLPSTAQPKIRYTPYDWSTLQFQHA